MEDVEKTGADSRAAPVTDSGPNSAAPLATEGLDARRARLIGSIYDVVLRPESFDSFMEDWSTYVDAAARRLGEIRVTETRARRVLEDPLIEVHFHRAMEILERMGRGADASTEDPANQRRVLLRIRRGGAVTDASPEAEAVFGPHPGLAAIRAALEPGSGARFDAFLAGFERSPASGRFAVLSLAPTPGARADGQPTGGQPTGGQPAGGLVSVVATRDTGEDAFVAELRAMRIDWSPALAAVLADSFRLTPREIGLVRDLTLGGDLQTIAARDGRSPNTVRAQLKSVFAKTRTGSQPELMRLVSVLVQHRPEGAAASVGEADLGEERRIDVGQGRMVPVHLFGPEDGLPVVFLHGMLEGLGVTRRLARALQASGVRLIAPVRANFGQAAPDPRVREAPDILARDVAGVLDALGIERALLLGHLAGALYAYGAAAWLGRRALGIVNVGGNLPVRSVEQFASMAPRQRALAYTARYAPAFLPPILRAAIARIDSDDAVGLVGSLYRTGSPDRALIADPAIASALVEGYRFTVAQGLQAFRIDAWQVVRDWSSLVAASDGPVLLIHGRHDPVIGIDQIRDFVARHPRTTLIEEPEHGQLVFYARPEAVMDQIARFGRAQLAALVAGRGG